MAEASRTGSSTGSLLSSTALPLYCTATSLSDSICYRVKTVVPVGENFFPTLLALCCTTEAYACVCNALTVVDSAVLQIA